MKLYAEAWQSAVAGRPWLIWLHGFLGCLEEWQPVAAGMTDYSHLFIDLPGHGKSSALQARHFQQVNDLLADTLISYNILNYWLVGYSLGGRIAMHFACQKPAGLQGLIVEGSHPGLPHPEERQARFVADCCWAQRLRQAPLAEVLKEWYRQPVFASLDEPQRAALITLRSRNDQHALAAMLEATSLGRQPNLRAPLAQLCLPFHYLYGEKDKKFAALAAELTATRHPIAAAGHNAHRENPQAAARCITAILLQHAKESP